MAGVYRPRHPERTVLYRLLFHYFERFLAEKEGQVGYRWGREATDQETMDYLEFIARVTSHIPDKGRIFFMTFFQSGGRSG
jgi:hypothetical protein